MEKAMEKEATLTGHKVRVINPTNGADINCPKHFAGYDFVLKRGEEKEFDEAIAKSACYVWSFLRMCEIQQLEDYRTAKKQAEEMSVVSLVEKINSVDPSYTYPTVNVIGESDKLEIDRYAFSVKQQILRALGTKGYMAMKKDKVNETLLNTSNIEILDALKELQVPVFFI